MRALRILALLALTAACAVPTSTMAPTASEPPSVQPTRAGTAVPTTAALTPTAPSTPTAAPTPTGAHVSPTPLASPGATAGPSLDLELSVELFAEGLPPLIFLTHNSDERLYAVAQTGQILVLDLDGAIQERPFLNIEERIVSGGEQGLLGMAFHPSGDGRFYLNYTNTEGDTVVSEFRTASTDPGNITADPASERILMTIFQPFPNHNGGMVAFGPDGYLYIGMGDGGSGGDPNRTGQSMVSILGKMLRVDVNTGDPYGVPPDNPFVDTSVVPEIWSLGWRNPWRFSFDRQTGDMFVGDVGQEVAEEISAEPAGAGGRNYGWNIMEGDLCFSADPCDQTGLTLPVTANHRERGECAIIGGYVYRGSAFPDLQGTYIYSDICTGDLWAFNAEAALTTGIAEPVIVGSAAEPSSFGEDANGELYVTNLNGEIYMVVAERVRP